MRFLKVGMFFLALTLLARMFGTIISAAQHSHEIREEVTHRVTQSGG